MASPHISTIWRLRPGLEKKFSKGHPWVFSNDLDQSPKGHPAGGYVELRDSKDHFLAFGYGNPSTLIAFRVLSRTPVDSPQHFLHHIFHQATQVRHLTSLDRYSHRLVFGEADGLPGIIIDRYLVTSPRELQVFVVQSSTAGGDQMLPEIIEALKGFSGKELAFSGQGKTLPAITVLAQDSSARAIEGLEKRERRLILPNENSLGQSDDKVGDKRAVGLDGNLATIAVQSGESATCEKFVEYDVDFMEGQKTGFFLDQRLNVRLAWPAVTHLARRCAKEGRPLRILDLFCYVGQWSVQIADAARTVQARCAVTLADSSASALDFAARNVARVGNVDVIKKKSDILNEITQYPVGSFDVVICDPPAFIKKKKDHPTGRAAYLKLNREALKRVAPAGLIVSCSCSGLLLESEFEEILSDARRLSSRDVLWLARGGHGEDHPFRAEFPQGRYLKGHVGLVSS